jgi:hypothetical protein
LIGGRGLLPHRANRLGHDVDYYGPPATVPPFFLWARTLAEIFSGHDTRSAFKEGFEMMSERRHVTLSREELYEEVWSTPTRKLALTYCLSDVGLKKFCKAHKIPTPPVGYLARKEAGKRVRQIPLPVLAESPPRTISLSYDPDPQPKTPARPSDPVTDPKLLALILSERDPANQITVPDHLRAAHPIIHKTRDALSETPSSDRYNLVRPNYQEADECVVMAVHKTSIMRSLR